MFYVNKLFQTVSKLYELFQTFQNFLYDQKHTEYLHFLSNILLP